MYRGLRVAAVVPAHNEAAHVAGVLRRMPDYVDLIVVVDDGSRDATAETARGVGDPRVEIIRHARPQGVGGATIAGMQLAVERGADVIAKVDGDGQMDPQLLSALLDPLATGGYGYSKGNRFLRPEALRQMPRLRLVGNFLLTFFTKLASGYWRVFDPQNGYVAIRAGVVEQLDLAHLARGFFFENDMLVHLNILDVPVKDVPMPAFYGDEESKMRIGRVLVTFPPHLFRRFWYRIYEKYVLRDFSPIGLFWCVGAALMVGGAAFGLATWAHSIASGRAATTGTVMLSVLPFLIGFELVLQAIILEIRESPR